MLDEFKVEVDFILPKFLIRVLNDFGLVPIESYFNARVDIYSSGVRKLEIK